MIVSCLRPADFRVKNCPKKGLFCDFSRAIRVLEIEEAQEIEDERPPLFSPFVQKDGIMVLFSANIALIQLSQQSSTTEKT